MEEMTFTELQQKMQLEKKKEGTAKYASRHVEDIYNIFKSLKSNWSVVVNYDLVEFSGKTYIKAIATASNKDEKMQAQAFAELSPVPILKTRNGELKQMNEPQWVGAVQSYAGKYALQALFAIGEEDIDHFEVAEQSLRPNQNHNQMQSHQQSNYINQQQHNQINQLIDELAKVTGQPVETVARYYLGKYKLNNFSELLTTGFDILANDIQDKIKQRKG
ncbi:single-stranded DNA-binding protein [Streptococcus phage P9902]|uniref:Single-stranded DNA-binding protein n=7 Tax=Aliceevansviridae TaxID=3044455 RepID=A0A286QT71_9CAUD|nr:Erf protein [Streptococcus phage Abc2]YP_010646344.1 Erf protein [Streptococcus phage CHPC979]YP_010647595.1 single-stranded DNA-binding protein [Streptococcus phage P9901]YP_010647643.1 single-stranded DNA-binding protein [Streptococcus phage P9902]YP_010647695.1 single-stranded DNA-binding protein [Streptococcus phage P9903]YP_010681882.1 Erf protein [Streptococcus phage SW4]YP_010682667.1 Erf protein [Streptococcus phage CHPC1248]AXF53505.1 Erf protein [Streptococcus phage 93]ACO83196